MCYAYRFHDLAPFESLIEPHHMVIFQLCLDKVTLIGRHDSSGTMMPDKYTVFSRFSKIQLALVFLTIDLFYVYFHQNGQ